MSDKRPAASRPRSGTAPSRAAAGRKPARAGAARPAPKSAPKTSRQPARGPGRLRRSTGGHRPFVLAFVVLVVAVSALVLGPLQRYTAAADRVEALDATREQLSQQVDRLEDRRATLEDPEELELIARTELGLVKPGEIPFVVVSPDDQVVEQVRPEPIDVAPPEGGPWYRRVGRAVSSLFDIDG